MLSTQLWSCPSQKGFNCQEQELGLCERLALRRASRGTTEAAAWNHLTRRQVSPLGWGQPCSSVRSGLDLPLWNLLCFFHQDRVQAFCNLFLLKSEAETRYRIHGSGDGVHQVVLLLSNALRGHEGMGTGDGWLAGLVGACNPGLCVRNWTFLEMMCSSLVSI